MDYLRLHAIELLGTIFSLIYLYLSVKQKAGLWIYGFLSSTLYFYVFLDAGIYAETSIQLYYLGVSIYGWISWRKGRLKSGEDFVIRRTGTIVWLQLSGFTVIFYLVYYLLLVKFTDSTVPVLDSFTSALSITATWMLARKRIEHWILWIIVDGVSAGLYFYKGLFPTGILFIIYTVMAITGYFAWKKDMQKQA